MILNTNLPKVTERLRSNIKKYNKSISDIYIIVSQKKKKSQNIQILGANWRSAKKNPLRFSRGMIILILGKLWELNKFNQYEYFSLSLLMIQ